MSKAGYRALGSIDIPETARSVIVCGRIKDDPEIRVLCQIKNFLEPEAPAIAFRHDKEIGFQWIGEVDITVDELMSGDCKISRLQEAGLFLKELLEYGKLSATEIFDLAEKEGIKQETLHNAEDKLGIAVTKKNNK